MPLQVVKKLFNGTMKIIVSKYFNLHFRYSRMMFIAGESYCLNEPGDGSTQSTFEVRVSM